MMKTTLLFVLLAMLLLSAAPPQKHSGIFGSTDLKLLDTASYSIGRDQPVGVYFKNSRPVTLKALYIYIANREYATVPFNVEVAVSPKISFNRHYPTAKLTSLLKKECRALSPGLLKVDVSGSNVRVQDNFVVLISANEETLKHEYTYDVKAVLRISGAERTISRREKGYGPRIGSYGKSAKKAYFIMVSNGRYAVSSVLGDNIAVPFVAVEYSNETALRPL